MNAGKFSERIILQKAESTMLNAAGECVPVYNDFISVRADVQPLKGREYLESQKIRSETSYKIHIRYNNITKEANAAMRVLYKSKVLEIESVLNIDGANEILQIRCFERV